MQFNIGDARKHWDVLAAAVERGEEVILARNGKPVAKIVPHQGPKVKPPGSMRGRIKISSDQDSRATSVEPDDLAPKLSRPDSSVARRS
jgi:antitoxin (DNA-binding transcriptional repressor) of toxin-antitoxin stability system